jgi:hypothetical protein
MLTFLRGVFETGGNVEVEEVDDEGEGSGVEVSLGIVVVVSSTALANAAGNAAGNIVPTTRQRARIRWGSFIGDEANCRPATVWVNAANALFSSDIKALSQRIPCKNCTFDTDREFHNSLESFEIAKWNRCIGFVAFFD